MQCNIFWPSKEGSSYTCYIICYSSEIITLIKRSQEKKSAYCITPFMYVHMSQIRYKYTYCCCCCCQVASVVSDSVRPHGLQPTKFLRPWDSPGKNTGVGCHFLLQCMKVKSESEVTQSCPTLTNPMDCSLPGSSVHGIFQARVLEWGAIAFPEELF